MRKIRGTFAVLAVAAAFGTMPRSPAGKPALSWDFGGVRHGWMTLPYAIGSGEQLGYKAPADPRERFVAFSGKDDQPGYGYLPYGRALWPPFRWEVTSGLPFEDHVDGLGSGSFGTELVTDELDSKSFTLSASKNSIGLAVLAQDPSFSSLGIRTYADATAVDLAIEYDGATMRYFARAEGAPSYDEIGHFDVVLTQPLFPVLSAYAFNKPAIIGFDRFRVASSAEAPAAATSATAAAIERLYDAFDAQLDALHALDGTASTNDQVRASITATDTFLAQAIAALKGGARGKAKSARAAAAAAANALAKGKPRETAAKSLRKALDFELAARKAASKPK